MPRTSTCFAPLPAMLKPTMRVSDPLPTLLRTETLVSREAAAPSAADPRPNRARAMTREAKRMTGSRNTDRILGEARSATVRLSPCRAPDTHATS